uniref:2-amino-4-hydroxy-6-hydroxymethyldihydropteridine pyrophosphokinase n=1 Tax=Magnetococcus massalia (strain MO-1) TaxID=451514 RepID=A0A1S7LL48_MAGMO|nr:2-amino-4-hydroxy-6-hydroxymethyldihydropteridinepyrophosphokinase [Candidatus Magnetococcus massalia]
MTTSSSAWIGLGANVGDPLKQCQDAVIALGRAPGVVSVSCSPWYRSEPLGPEQPWYINGAAVLQTTLEPQALLKLLHQLERQFGRDRSREERWGPRPLDLDLLLYADRVLDQEGLTIPHPGLALRRFVLTPLADIAPSQQHPVLGKTVDTLLHEVEDKSLVERLPLAAYNH